MQKRTNPESHFDRKIRKLFQITYIDASWKHKPSVELTDNGFIDVWILC